jgi:hypothetical protein
MDEDGFRRFLKQKGKAAHVIDGLAAQVERFAQWLAQQGRAGLENATAQDIQAYAANIEAAEPGKAAKRVRGLALYYQFNGKPDLATAAHSIREAGVARDRQPLALKDLRGTSPDDIARLKRAGIEHAGQMIEAGSTPQARQRLAETTGVSPHAILELVKLSDLSRIEGVKGVRARLYYDAGVDTLDKLAQCDPDALRTLLVQFVERTGFDGIPALPKEIRSTIATARKLPRLVQY